MRFNAPNLIHIKEYNVLRIINGGMNMSVMPKRTITSTSPLSVKEIAEFANAIKVGDTLYAMVPYRVWTSSTNYNTHYRPAKVTILN